MRMNAEDEAELLRRFVEWLASEGVDGIDGTMIYEFLEYNR